MKYNLQTEHEELLAAVNARMKNLTENGLFKLKLTNRVSNPKAGAKDLYNSSSLYEMTADNTITTVIKLPRDNEHSNDK